MPLDFNLPVHMLAWNKGEENGGPTFGDFCCIGADPDENGQNAKRCLLLFTTVAAVKIFLVGNPLFQRAHAATVDKASSLILLIQHCRTAIQAERVTIDPLAPPFAWHWASRVVEYLEDKEAAEPA